MTTLREAAQQALEVLEAGPDVDPILAGETEDALRAALAEPEQRPISDVTEAVTKTVIETEKLLCEKIGRQWQASGMSIRTLVDELATLVAEREREAIGNIILDYAGRDDLSDSDESLLKHLFELIRARGKT